MINYRQFSLIIFIFLSTNLHAQKEYDFKKLQELAEKELNVPDRKGIERTENNTSFKIKELARNQSDWQFGLSYKQGDANGLLKLSSGETIDLDLVPQLNIYGLNICRNLSKIESGLIVLPLCGSIDYGLRRYDLQGGGNEISDVQLTYLSFIADIRTETRLYYEPIRLVLGAGFSYETLSQSSLDNTANKSHEYNSWHWETGLKLSFYNKVYSEFIYFKKNYITNANAKIDTDNIELKLGMYF